MAKLLKVGDKGFKVVENMGFNQDIGMYSKVVLSGDQELMVVAHSRSGPWRFWGPEDRLSGGSASRGVGM